MNLLTKHTIAIIFFLLLSANVFVFIHSIKLSDEINHFEKEIKVLHQENLSLENKMYEIDSLQYASSIATQLNFTDKAQPIYLENLKYARSQ
ncbi:hypothetical protein HY357_01575 [Candidatus Roizmanbacteria bacterium]|nr:hypothetical protein [Candidatus Roizmanbacteria bacterium]